MTEKQTTLERVIRVIRECKRIDRPIAAENSLRELEVDSLDVLLLIGELEEEFNIEIVDTQLEGVETVQDIVNRLEAIL